MGTVRIFFLFSIAVATFAVCYAEEEEESRYTDAVEVSNPQLTWNWKNKDGFVCPAIYGRYAHPKDCSLFYECRFSWPHLMKCNRGKLYDEKKEQCRDKRHVKCHKNGRDDDKSKEDNSKEEEDNNGVFKCPYIWGTFAHPVDCSKYYVCVYNVPALFQCYGTDLYDERNRKCKDKRRVKCGKRLDRDEMKTSKRPTTRFLTTPGIREPETTTVEARTTQVEITTQKENRFHCPFPYGRYPDPHDCSQFYACHFSVPTLEKCPSSTLYDERKEQCVEAKYVKCGERPGGVGGGNEEEEKVKKEKFICPYIWGTFPHPDDCSKYIICIYNVPTVFSCRKTELFHAYYRRCFPSDQVTCDYRINPDDLTFPPRETTTAISSTRSTVKVTMPSTTTTPSTTTPTPTTTIPTTTAEPTTTTRPSTTIPTTTAEPTTTTTTKPTVIIPSTTTTTTTVTPRTSPTTTTSRPTTIPTVRSTTRKPVTPTTTVTTRKPKPNTPPPTDCDDDDVDCIIDETKDVKSWFDCPERYGHFPHGSSYQLFIHCDNWRPFIKRCAEETAFSPKYLVCMWIAKPIPK